MSEPTSAARPVLIYDGKCGFCRIWIDYWRQLTGNRIEYAASQDVGAQYPQIPEKAFTESVQLVQSDGTVTSGAHAVSQTLGLLWLYRLVSGPSEFLYHFIARHRNFAYQVTKFTFGTRIERVRFEAVQWIFVRLLAAVYAVAFLSLAEQVEGLIGSHGITPAVDLLRTLSLQGAIRFLAVPSLFWLGADDRTLTGMAWCGLALSVALFFTGFIRRRFERFLLALVFILYLSFNAIGQEFLAFQWDSLLLEAGFLAIFLGRNRIIPIMFRWLAFRLYFLSGSVKLLSGDPTWRNLSALSFHFHTQPLPTVLAWYANQLPPGFLRATTWMVLAIEIVVPFLIFLPRRIRLTAAAWMIGLQVAILLTGNYAFFNFLTIGITLFALDDQALRRFVPGEIREAFGRTAGLWETRVAAVLALAILCLGAGHFWQTFRGSSPLPLDLALRYTAPFSIVNSYGLFAVMTTERREITVEGSTDGHNWKKYEFRFKPDDPQQAPRWVAPFQPRLDWQMWFAALGTYQSNQWFVGFALRLLEGSEPVENLLATNPFPDHPPRYIRATLADYKFTDFATRRRTGAWWLVEPRGQYLPPVGLRAAVSSPTP
jgi:predicted DCC family thiol-disulfide oxidoreductase YuxK